MVTKPGSFLLNKSQCPNEVMVKPSASTLMAIIRRIARGMKAARKAEKLKMKESKDHTVENSMRYMTWSRCACGSSESASFLMFDFIMVLIFFLW